MHCSSSWHSGISVSLLFKFITNLFDPWEILTEEWVLSLFKDHNSHLNSMFTVQVTGCIFQHGSNFCVPSDPSFWLWCWFFSWKSAFTTGHWWEFCSIFHHEILSDFNNIQKSCIHTNFTQSVLLCNFSIRSPYCCSRRAWFAGSSQSKRTSVLITLCTNEELDCPLTTGCPVLSWRDSYSSHISRDCSVKTELVCRDNYAKNSFNRFQIGCIVYRQFSMSFAFQLTSGQLGS